MKAKYIPTDEYLIKLRSYLWALEHDENYEECAFVRNMITAIEKRDKVAYIDLVVPINDLVNNAVFEKGDSYDVMEEKLLGLFRLPSIFHYQIIDQDIQTHLNDIRDGKLRSYGNRN